MFSCFYYSLWVYEICRGVDNEAVSARLVPKSIGCSKNFQGKACLDTKEKVSLNIFLSII